MLDTRQLTGKQRLLIQQLQPQQTIESLQQFCRQRAIDFNFAKGFLLSGVIDDWVQLQALSETAWVLTDKGEALQGRLPGSNLVDKLQRGVSEVSQLQMLLGQTFSLAYGALRKAGAIDMQGSEGEKEIVVLDAEKLSTYQQRQASFAAIAQGAASPDTYPDVHLDWLQQQGYIAEKTATDYRLTISPRLAQLDLQPLVTALTSELLLSEQWREVELKSYNIHDPVPDIAYGRPTILTQCIQQIRDIFLNMGFDEMSGFLVETAFWNFDALFTPQDHPAREMQDTFYLSQPQQLPLPEDAALIEGIQRAHEDNYGGSWTTEVASRAILRAHTTSSTARRLYALRGRDGKYFSIDKVFRNETVDRTHLAEFHQIEGVVVGELLSVRTLMGYLTYFYERLGFKDLKFKPTYNPYTEPSLEVYAYHAPSQRYLEVGNSGLFRPEMLGSLGCGEKATIAWGLGLERIAMLLYEVEKLSDLAGPDMRLQGPL
ncbi:MAG: phenylalanine--tRNA ligase subunit alpha [Leptolyngbya sp. SIO4C1]|nr:phenylalanine--tRNA ligase subunit alpha [Leptolyngbya sp. SIO4C1]